MAISVVIFDIVSAIKPGDICGNICGNISCYICHKSLVIFVVISLIIFAQFAVIYPVNDWWYLWQYLW